MTETQTPDVRPGAASTLTVPPRAATVQSHVPNVTPLGQVGYWIDPETSERLPFDPGDDALGVPVSGQDSRGRWWGTRRAAWLLSDNAQVVRVSGWVMPDGKDAARDMLPWDGWFVGTKEQAENCARMCGVHISFTECGIEATEPDYL
jgi:hypothetical protein